MARNIKTKMLTEEKNKSKLFWRKTNLRVKKKQKKKKKRAKYEFLVEPAENRFPRVSTLVVAGGFTLYKID